MLSSVSEPRHPARGGLGQAVEARLERLVFGSGLVFNQTWEDPAVDAAALAVTAEDTLVSIAGAGDNVLHLALAGPRHVYAVDLNPAQVALLKLKLAAARRLEYADFWRLFSLAPAPRAAAIYWTALRPHLDDAAQRYWDARLPMLQAGLYRAGAFGRAVWLLRAYLRLVCGARTLERFFECSSLDEQAEFYLSRIHRRWWNPLATPFAARLPVLVLFGAHPHQVDRVRGHDFAAYLARGIARALTTLPARDNYFWQQVFLGRYLTPPPYLRPENFARLKAGVAAIEARCGRLEDMLQALPPRSVTRVNLLDAPDWLTPEQAAQWWDALDRVVAPGGRVLFHSIDPGYRLPEAVTRRWQDVSEPGWTAQERTGVYAGVYVCVRRGGRP